MDSPATVVVMMLLLLVTTSQLPGTSHCMVMSNSSNVSNWCDGRLGQCQLIPQEGLDLLEPDDSFRHLVELDDSGYQETRRIMRGTNTIFVRTQIRGRPVQCGRRGQRSCLSAIGGNFEMCGQYKRNCHRY